MRSRRIQTALLAAFLWAPGTESIAADEVDGHTEFVSALVAAINSHDVAQREALLHPGSRHCRLEEATTLRESMLRRQTSTTIPADYRWQAVALPENTPPMFADRFDYPVRPTHVVQLFYDRGPQQSTTLVVQVARDGAAWREVVPCLKPAALQEMRAARAEQAKQKARGDALLAQMRPALKAQLIKMVREGRKVDAIKRYREAVGEDLTIAKYVVDRLSETSTP